MQSRPEIDTSLWSGNLPERENIEGVTISKEGVLRKIEADKPPFFARVHPPFTFLANVTPKHMFFGVVLCLHDHGLSPGIVFVRVFLGRDCSENDRLLPLSLSGAPAGLR